MKMNQTVQCTIRDVPVRAHEALRRHARKAGVSMNTAAVEALLQGLGLADEPAEHHDLDDLAGTWASDPATDLALDSMRHIDVELWK